MIVNKGTLLCVNHKRKGMFKAIALKTFDADNTEFYPLTVAESLVKGKCVSWSVGEEIPCSSKMCNVSVIDPEEQ